MDSLIYPFSCLACSPRMDCCYRPALVARTTLPRLRGCTALQTLIIHEVAGWSILLSWHLGYASAGCKSPYPARCPAERAPRPLSRRERAGVRASVKGEGTAGEVSLQDRAAHPDVPFDLTHESEVRDN